MAESRPNDSAPRLVWVPEDMLARLDDTPAGLEVAAIPSDPASDLRLADVALLVMPARFPSTAAEGETGPSPARVFAGLYDRMASLRCVQVLSAGVDWIIDEIPPGVALCSGRGAHDVSVSEWVLAAILGGLKDLGGWRDDMRAGRWASRDLPEIDGAIVVLLGYGSIGRAVEQRLAPFRPASICRIARHEREGVQTIDALPEVLPHADIVVVLLPLTKETRGIVDAAFLARMKPGALLVNAARGKLVDQDALLAALNEGRVRAVLDVVDPEPLPARHPLWQAPGLLITPHIAGGSFHLDERTATLVREQLGRFSRGEPLLNVAREGY